MVLSTNTLAFHHWQDNAGHAASATCASSEDIEDLSDLERFFKLETPAPAAAPIPDEDGSLARVQGA